MIGSTRTLERDRLKQCVTMDKNVGGARVSPDTRAAIFSDQTFRGRRWDSASDIKQAILRGAHTQPGGGVK